MQKRGRGRQIGRTKGGRNTQLHVGTEENGRPIRFFMTAGPVSDDTGTAALLGGRPAATCLLAPSHRLKTDRCRATNRGYDADWFRDCLRNKGITPCIPGRKSRGKLIKYDKRRYKRRNRIEIMFGRLKNWRRVAAR